MPDTTNIEQKLDAILEYMQRMDRRDKWRMIGGFIRSLIAIIPIIIVIWSSYYFAMHWEEIMKNITEMSVAAAKQSAQGTSDSMIDSIKTKYGIQ
ncbi:MAG: hypothetical protein KBD00_06015 [Candidatus Peribacteraceae bacterium]|nr:hypothetical protein [Candidatus Peribacteraceae bacterium]